MLGSNNIHQLDITDYCYFLTYADTLSTFVLFTKLETDLPDIRILPSIKIDRFMLKPGFLEKLVSDIKKIHDDDDEEYREK